MRYFITVLLFITNLLAISQLKVICDLDGSEIYVDGAFKTECDKDEPVRILVKSGRHALLIKKSTSDGIYKFQKSFKIGDGVQKTVEASSSITYNEKHYYNLAFNSNNMDDVDYYLKHFLKHKKTILQRKEYIKAISNYNYFQKNEKRLKNNIFYTQIISHYYNNPLIKTVSQSKLFSINKKYIVINDIDNNIKVYDKNNFDYIKTIYANNKNYYSQCLDINNIGTILTNKDYKFSAIYNFSRIDTLSSRVFCHQGVFFHKDSNKAVIIGKDGIRVEIWDIKDKKIIYSKDDMYNLSSINISKDDKYIYFSRYKESNNKFKYPMYRINTITKKIIIALRLTNEIKSIYPLKDNYHFLLGVAKGEDKQDKTILLINTKELNHPKIERTFNSYQTINYIDMDSDEKYFVSADKKGNIKYWDFKTGLVIKNIKDNSSVKKAILDKDHIYSVNNSNQFKIFSTKYLSLTNLKQNLLKDCKIGDILSCNKYLKVDPKNKTAKKEIVSRFKKYLHKSFKNPKIYIIEDGIKYRFKEKNAYIDFVLLSIMSDKNKTYAMVKFLFHNTEFTFNSPIYFIQNGQKVSYAKRYPAVKKIKNRGSQVVILEFDNFTPKNQKTSIVENNGCKGCLQFKDFQIKGAI